MMNKKLLAVVTLTYIYHDGTWRPSPLRVGSLDPGLREKIIDINIHSIIFHPTP